MFRIAQKYAGAGVKSADRITLLRDADGDGVAETRSIFLDQLHSPIGMALVGSDFFVLTPKVGLRSQACCAPAPHLDAASLIGWYGCRYRY